MAKHEFSRAADTLLEVLEANLTQPEILRLRFVCKIFERCVTSSNLFGILYVSPWYVCQKDQHWPAMQRIGSLCRELVVNIPTTGPPCKASTGIVFDYSPNLPPNGDWTAVFSCLCNLQTLTLYSRLPLSHSNTLTYETAGLLAHLCAALAQHPPQTRHLHLRGLPAQHTLFLRHSSASYASALAPTPSPWAALTALTLQLAPPPAPAQRDATKVLHAWLRALAPRLRALRFAWLHAGFANRGPHPLALDLALREGRRGGSERAVWSALRELWVAGVAWEDAVRFVVVARASVLRRYLVLAGAVARGETLRFDEVVERWNDVPVCGQALLVNKSVVEVGV